MTRLVQILMATYNSERFVEEQVRSILAQSERDWTLIIRDDASQDRTPQLLRQLRALRPDRIQIIEGTANLGARRNFAKLLEVADAPYVMFSDSDDIWLPEKIAKTLERMRRIEDTWGQDKPSLVHTDLQVVDTNLHVLDESYWSYEGLRPNIGGRLERLLIQNCITGCTMMLNRALVQCARPIPDAAIMHDWWIALAAATLGLIDLVEEPTILYRQHGRNALGAKRRGWRHYMSMAFRTFDVSQRNTLLLALERAQGQAQAFLDQYEARLDVRQRELFDAFIGLRKTNALARRVTLTRYGFFKSHIASTIGLYLRM